MATASSTSNVCLLIEEDDETLTTLDMGSPMINQDEEMATSSSCYQNLQVMSQMSLSLRLSQQTPRIEFDRVVARYYLAPYLLYIENEQRILNDKISNLDKTDRNKLISDQLISDEVEAIVGSITHYLNEEGNVLFHNGVLSMCGSVAEGTKVSSCDEFDFQYLVHLENYQAYRKPLLRTKPRSINEATKSFYSLKLLTPIGGEQELLAKDVHDQFRDDVERALSKLDLSYKVDLKKAGPAVKIVLWEKGVRKWDKCYVKIDLTFGIKADPKELFLKEELTPFSQSLPWGLTLKCHFVCAHDYWKVGFVQTEQELMRKICEEDKFKMVCYRALKCLRDKVDIKDPYGDGILPSYPIKMTFLDIALQDCRDGIMWNMYDLGEHTIHILREVEERGQGHQLKCLFLQGDDVMAEADRSYLESRRILQELKRVEGLFFGQQSFLLNFLIVASLIPYLLEYAFTLAFVRTQADAEISNGFWNVHYITQITMIVFCILLSVLEKSQRETHPLSRIHPNMIVLKSTFVFIGILTLILPFLDMPQGHCKPLCNKGTSGILIMKFVVLFPAFITGLSVSWSAILSLVKGENYILYDLFLTFPLSWSWRAPNGDRYDFLPELYGAEGLRGFAWLRALAIACFTPISIIFTSFTTVALQFEDNLSIIQGMLRLCAVNLILILILAFLLFLQHVESKAMRQYLSKIWQKRCQSCLTSPLCYFLPYIFCPRASCVKNALKTV